MSLLRPGVMKQHKNSKPHQALKNAIVCYQDPNQLIRASALRVLSSIRVPMIVPIMQLAVKEGVNDMSPYVRKTAAHAIPKLYRYAQIQACKNKELMDIGSISPLATWVALLKLLMWRRQLKQAANKEIGPCAQFIFSCLFSWDVLSATCSVDLMLILKRASLLSTRVFSHFLGHCMHSSLFYVLVFSFSFCLLSNYLLVYFL